MKAITLTPPWAVAVAMGVKKIETRSWDTKFRGTILIHASSERRLKHRRLVEQLPFSSFIKAYDDLPFGCIIGCVDIVDTKPSEEIITDRAIFTDTIEQCLEYQLGDYSKNRFGWQLENPLLFDRVIPCKGHLSLWNVPKEEAWIATLQIETKGGKS